MTGHPFGDFAAQIGVCETCGSRPCLCKKDAARESELRADYVAQLVALDGERYEAQTALAQVLGWGDFRECSSAQQEQFAAWAREVGLSHLGNPHVRPELFAPRASHSHDLPEASP